MEQGGVRESERAQNRKSDQVIGFLPTSHFSLALWAVRASQRMGPLPLTSVSLCFVDSSPLQLSCVVYVLCCKLEKGDLHGLGTKLCFSILNWGKKTAHELKCSPDFCPAHHICCMPTVFILTLWFLFSRHVACVGK